MGDNILCKDILYNMNNFLTFNDSITKEYKINFIEHLTINYISCEETFMDSYLEFKDFVNEYKKEKKDNYRPL